jgi:hypothetical protein
MTAMRAMIVRDRAADIDGLELAEMPYPHAAENDVFVRVHAAGFTRVDSAQPPDWWPHRVLQRHARGGRRTARISAGSPHGALCGARPFPHRSSQRRLLLSGLFC